MVRWEYTTHKFEAAGLQGGKIDDQALVTTLNHLGAEGWELVVVTEAAAIGGSTRQMVAILKRQTA